MPGRIARIVDWIDSKIDKPAKRKPVNPGSEQMIDSDMGREWARSVRNRRRAGNRGL
jgi:hypothetical protein